MPDIGFTGTRKGMTARQKRSLTRLLTCLNSGIGVFHHGGAEGADTDAAKIAKKVWGEDRIKVHKPKRKSAKELLARNERIVNASLILIAAPRKLNEEVRSGTWHTIRYARKSKDKAVLILDP
jgi:hypothetical protein